MKATEINALGRLVTHAVTGGTQRVQEVQTAFAHRALKVFGLPSVPARLMHDGISALTYGGVRLGVGAGLGTVGKVATGVATLNECLTAPTSLTERPLPSLALAVLNGWVGDRLHADYHPLATPLGLRHRRREVPTDATSLLETYPEPTSRLVVFLHGLIENELWWHPLPGSGGVHFGETLRDDLGYTPIYLRYNSGRRISANGWSLATLLDQVVTNWPVPVTDLVLIGHSMGGLLARSAVTQAEHGRAPAGWLPATRATITLGTPHFGAPLEKAANKLARGLRRLPETRPLATVLSLRSDGIKDLRLGILLDEDWADLDPEHPHDSRVPVPPHDHIPLFVAYTTVTEDPDHKLAHLLGDLLVTPSSAAGHSWDLPEDQVLHLGGRHHLDLLHDPTVYERIKQWIGPVANGPGQEAGGAGISRDDLVS